MRWRGGGHEADMMERVEEEGGDGGRLGGGGEEERRSGEDEEGRGKPEGERKRWRRGEEKSTGGGKR